MGLMVWSVQVGGDGTDGVECAGGGMGLMVWSVQVGGWD